MVILLRLVIKLVFFAAATWLLASGVMFVSMLALPPVQLASLAARVPGPILMGVLPFRQTWTLARRGSLHIGDQAPDFDLPRHDAAGRVRLTSFIGRQPVVLVFGSYT